MRAGAAVGGRAGVILIGANSRAVAGGRAAVLPPSLVAGLARVRVGRYPACMAFVDRIARISFPA